MSTEVERRALIFDRALGLFLGALIGGALTALYGNEWWVAPLAGLTVASYCYVRWKTTP